MTGKRYYIATLGAWRRHAARFANSHFIAIDTPPDSSPHAPDAALPGDFAAAPEAREGNCAPSETSGPADATRILALVEADEGAHLALEDDPAFEALPHPLAQKPISDAAQAALALHGVAPGATMFDAAEAAARVHPLLRHRVF